MSNPHEFVGGTFFRLCVLCGREINNYKYHFAPHGSSVTTDDVGNLHLRVEHKQRTRSEAIAGTYRELLSHANGENMELRAENRRLKAALRKIRVDCFDDSEWAQIIDSALSGKP